MLTFHSLKVCNLEGIIRFSSRFGSWRNINLSSSSGIFLSRVNFKGNIIFLQKFQDYQVQPKCSYAMRLELSEYGIIWRRPEKIPVWKPEKAGDLIPFEDVDVTKPVLDLLPVADEIAKKDEKVQKLLSIEFNSEKDLIETAKYRMLRRVQRHRLDESSHEAIIAFQTTHIRHLQKYVEANPRKKRARILLQEIIDKRRSRLTRLRKVDYKCFEWLLEKLGLFYKPNPEVYELASRKNSLAKLVDLHCEQLKREKMEKLKQELEIMKKPFLKEKREVLKWIADTEKKLGLPISVEIPPDETEIGSSKLLTSNENEMKHKT